MQSTPEHDADQRRSEKESAGSRANFATWAATAVVIAMALAGGGYWLASQPNPPEIEILIPTPVPPGPIVVQVDGEVLSPGVYTLGPGARVEDALRAAGGPSSLADLRAVNRASPLADGQRLVIPATLEVVSDTAAQQIATPFSSGGLVDLNTATLEELEGLPGIGEVRAQAIIDWRNLNGPFVVVDDLLAVPGIGPATLEGLRGLVVP